MSPDRLTPEDQVRLTKLCVVCAVACVVFAGVVGSSSLSQQGAVQDNTTNATVAKSRADTAQSRADSAQSRADAAHEDVVAAKKQAGQADRRSKHTVQYLRGDRGYAGIPGRNGKLGARGPGGLPGIPGARGPGPTQTQVEVAVARRCAAISCAIPPTQAQVIAALHDCAASGECRGPQGDAGRDGKDGSDAPPPTDVQLDESTARYCEAHNQCSGAPGRAGPEGPAGPQGPNGPPGPAPAGVQTVRPDGNGGVEACIATDPDGDLTFTCP